MPAKKSRRTAFTLVELLVVIAIISLLAGLLLPALETAIKSANAIECRNRMRQCLMTDSVYADDHNGWGVPTSLNLGANDYCSGGVPRWPDFLNYYRQGYIDDGDIMVCPTWNPYQYTKAKHSQVYGKVLHHTEPWVGPGIALNASIMPLPSRTPVFVDSVLYLKDDGTGGVQNYYARNERSDWHFRHLRLCNVGVADGHVETSDPSEDDDTWNRGLVQIRYYAAGGWPLYLNHICD